MMTDISLESEAFWCKCFHFDMLPTVPLSASHEGSFRSKKTIGEWGCVCEKSGRHIPLPPFSKLKADENRR